MLSSPIKPQAVGPFSSLRRHWDVYLMEAWGLGTFMAMASLLTTLLESPASPIHQALPAMSVRLLLLGIGMGLVVAGIVYSPWGKRSGAHINPAVTWVFFRLGKITFWDAIFYTVAQCGGAICSIFLMSLLLGAPFAHAPIDYALPKVGLAGIGVAFWAEFGISFLLMFILLAAVNSKTWEKKAGVMVALLIAIYLTFETPLSGMSLNPARTFGSEIFAQQWKTFWIYLIAPSSAMLLATELFYRWKGSFDGPVYPVVPI